MVNVKKVSILLFGFFSLLMIVQNPLIAKFTTKQAAIADFKTVLRRVFGASNVNVFSNKLDTLDLQQFNTFFNNMQQFVNEKAVNALGVQDKDILTSYQVIKAASLDLVNCVKVIFVVYASKSSTVSYTSKDIASAQAQMNKVALIARTLDKEEKNPVLMKLKNGVTTMQGKKDVIDVLQEMCRELSKYVEKVQYDYTMI